jgi:hypothetical protein
MVCVGGQIHSPVRTPSIVTPKSWQYICNAWSWISTVLSWGNLMYCIWAVSGWRPAFLIVEVGWASGDFSDLIYIQLLWNNPYYSTIERMDLILLAHFLYFIRQGMLYFVNVSMPVLTFEQMDCVVRNWIEETYPALVLKKKMRFREKRNQFWEELYYTHFPPKWFDQYGEASRN